MQTLNTGHYRLILNYKNLVYHPKEYIDFPFLLRLNDRFPKYNYISIFWVERYDQNYAYLLCTEYKRFRGQGLFPLLKRGYFYEGDQIDDLGIKGKIILRVIVKKQDGMMWPNSSNFRQGQTTVSCEKIARFKKNVK